MTQRSVEIDDVLIDYEWNNPLGTARSKPINVVLVPEIKNWCDENTPGWVIRYIGKRYEPQFGGVANKGWGWVIPQYKIVFKTVRDAATFKLRWL